VVGASDSKAIGAMACALEREINIPEDILFVSIDNTLAHQADPPLAAVAMPFEAMGYQAAAQAQLAWTRQKNISSCIAHICLRPSLVER